MLTLTCLRPPIPDHSVPPTAPPAGSHLCSGRKAAQRPMADDVACCTQSRSVPVRQGDGGLKLPRTYTSGPLSRSGIRSYSAIDAPG